MVVIALPLHLHAKVSMEAMEAGKHVLCEKLMAWNIAQCKDMIAVADRTNRLLSIGHQRHYSMLYAHAVEVINSGVLGDIRYIRALWHRNNSNPDRDSWRPAIKPEDRQALESNLSKYDYKSMEEMVRWRLYKRTGGGLMAELGSHQLDASSIFLGKVKPLAVTAVGGKYFYTDDREVEDNVFCTYEFPGKNYQNKPDRKPDGTCENSDKVIVTYSSISTNSFEQYGECVMGTNGTMIIEKGEQNIYLWGVTGRSTSVTATTSGTAEARRLRLDRSR